MHSSQGKKPAQWVEENVTLIAQRQAEFHDGVERGIAAADRRVWARVEKFLQS